jgi:hypothetical protein
MKMALIEPVGADSSRGGVVVYNTPPSERRRRWKFGKL